MAKYRWNTVEEWLIWYYNEAQINSDRLLNLIVNVVDSDIIQSEFEAEMDETGFFDVINDDKSMVL
jgi:hypothetical protein